MTAPLTIAVLGAGSWGVTLAKLLSEKGNDVRVWCFLDEEAEMLEAERERSDILPGVKLPESVFISTDAAATADGADVVLFAVPSFGVRATAERIKETVSLNALAVSAAKGIEEGTYKRMTEVLESELSETRGVAALSGPSHAEEVSRKMPTTVTVASTDEAAAAELQELFMTPYFRVYTNDDVIGVEMGAALKNVIAIASGVADGLGFGDNSKGALLTRGLAEIKRLGVDMGARPETFAGLSGLGDLITTCMSRHSRNRYVGERLGRGEKLDDIVAGMKMVAEGVKTTRTARELARDRDVEMPITEEMYNVMFDGKDAREAVNDLMTREAKAED
ncbi:MAG: NAD(P)H-dependent glycerol-3-phosphate dehydrogenase [Candidatus Coatesbacteria bacterium]|nr:MAG: NAD(P)H-dependent glycerol-3-phosphate dehydrogenase [Candidatus Coatesbacteria bacterium]